MTPDMVIDLSQQALYLIAMIAAPMLLSALAIGLLIGMFQAATSINEQTLSFIPKLMVLLLSILIAGPWMLNMLLSFTRRLYLDIPASSGDRQVDFDFAQATAFVGSLIWPMMRIGAMLLAMPVIGTRLVPTRAKIIITFVLSVLVLPLLPALPQVEALSLEGLFISAQQILIGLSMGFTLQLVFGALMIAGEAIAMSMGLGFASMVDPTNGVNVPVISQFLIIIGTLLFLALGGHLMLIQLVVSSFESLPISSSGVGRDSFWALFAWGSQMFIGAIWVAIPALISMLVITLSMGVMTRAAPQLNIFSVGFPVTMFMGFIILILVLPGFLPRINQMMLQAMQLSQSIVTP